MRYGDRTLTGLLFLLGSVQFLLAMVIGEGSLPTYSVSKNAISDLGVGPTAALFNTSVLLLGLLTLGAAYFYHRTHGKLWITIPFLLAGVGPIGVGLFPETTGAIHGIFALIAFLFGGLLAILISTRVTVPFRYVSILLGVVGLVALGLFVAQQYAGIGFGGMERMIAYPVLLWGVAFGGYLLSTTEQSAPAGPTGDAGT
ncbi:MAG TPA: DUF998 domain-containing protein [Thermoplasmata archaeon]|nr:DUF998 domain-containing protein [Thermoplasmata archaeon]